MVPDRDLPVPLYHQVKTLILRDIEAERWQPDDRLPTEGELADRFKVSKITIRQAMRDLVNLGYVRREQGRGTFVQRPPINLGPRELTSFTTEMRGHAMRASSEVLEQGFIDDDDIAAKLEMSGGTLLFRLRRLRLADGEPMGIQMAYIPAALVPGIDTIDFASASLYDVLSARYNLAPVSAHETHMAVAVGTDDARLLHVLPGSAAMAAVRISRLTDGRPLECVESIMRGDRYTIVLDLVQSPPRR
jgi:GntR family transcriptional regulator